MKGQVLVDGRPAWKCWSCGDVWPVPPHQDALEYYEALSEWQQAHTQETTGTVRSHRPAIAAASEARQP